MLHLQDVGVLALALIVHYYYRYRHRSRLPLPPGPKRWPVIGNALTIPTAHTYKYYDELARKLGEMSFSLNCIRRVY